MSHNLPRVTNLRKVVPSSLFMLAVAVLMVGLTSMSSLASGSVPPAIPSTETVVPPLEASISLSSNSRTDYQIGDSGKLRGQAINPSGGNLIFRWELVEGPAQSFSDQDATVCPETQSTSNSLDCDITARFFGPEDVGDWKVRLTIVDGNQSATDEITITVEGFEDDERRPTHSELSTIAPIQRWTDSNNQENFGIKYEDWNFKSLLVYTDISGLTYWNNPSDTDLPNGERELNYMQVPLVPILERITELAEHEGINLILTDAWDQDDGHATYSIHYEGRALDLDMAAIGGNGSDQDRAALGRLAYLAERSLQEAGVDYWVWHEHNHVHLSINAEHAYDPRWGTLCSGANCLDHVQQKNNAKSGAAVASMILDWVSHSVDQETLFAHAGSPASGLSCQQVAELLNDYTTIQWTCIQYGTFDQALRATAYWLDWGEDFWGVTFPAALPLSGNYYHWVGIEGATATRIPLDQGTMNNPDIGDHIINGFFIDDASLNMLHRNMKRFEGRNALSESFRALPGVYYGAVVATGCQSEYSSNNQQMVSSTSASNNATTDSSFCGNPVWIQSPEDNTAIDPGSNLSVEVQTVFGASNVRLHVNGQILSPSGGDGLTRYDFVWAVPDTPGRSYALQASATINGNEERSPYVNVTTSGDKPGPLSLNFSNLQDGGSVSHDQAISVVVTSQSIGTVLLKIEPDDDDRMEDGRGWMDSNGEDRWISDGEWIPQIASEKYTLTAIGYAEYGNETITKEITVLVMPDDPTIDVPDSVMLETVDNEKVAKVDVTVTAPGAFTVSLLINGGSFEPVGQVGAEWQFDWTLNARGKFTVYAVASYSAHADKRTEDVEVEVIDENTNFFDLTVTTASPVNRGARNKATITAGRALSKVEIAVIDPKGKEENRFSYELESCSEIPKENWNFTVLSVGALWNANNTGEYTIIGHAWDCESHHAWTEVGAQVTVVEPPPADPLDKGDWTWINSYAFLWENKQKIKWGYDTEIPVDKYVCGVIGFDVRGGDIGERYDGNIINVNLDTNGQDKNNSWWINADFNTWHLGYVDDKADFDWMRDDYGEEWDVNLICFDRSKISRDGPETGKPIFTKPLTGLGDARSTATGVNANAYTCGIAGFDSGRGDINEKGAGHIIKTYLDIRNGEWYVTADFNTHDVSLENWKVDMLCVENSWAAIDSPAVGKPFVFKSYWNKGNKDEGALGDNIDYPTEFLVDEWVCGISGFAAMNGDIDEGKGGSRILVRVEMEENSNDGKWHILADFRTHKDGESWNVNVMCLAKEGVSIQSVEPYLFTGLDPNRNLYGPGMKIEFTDSHDPQANYYRIQYSTTGGEPWTNIWDNPRKLSDGSRINHHGWDSDCGWDPSDGGAFDLYGRCLPLNTKYFYRVGLLEKIDDKAPINGHWSDPVSATSYDWPASFVVRVVKENVAGLNGDYYKIYLNQVHGPGIKFSWTFEPIRGATYQKISTCGSSSTYCRISVQYPSGTSASDLTTIAEDIPEPGINVIIKGIDEYARGDKYTQHEYTQAVYIEADPSSGGGDPRSTFSDVPTEHWAYTYIEYLSNQGITSGCTTEGESNFCPDDSLFRSQQAVFTVRSRHPEAPGYVPPSPEQVIFIDEEAQPFASVASTSPDLAYRAEIYWYDKYAQELYDDGVISGCSTDPVKFCPNDVTTRAQMTVFVVRLLHGEDFTPPEPTHQTYHDAPHYSMEGESIWSGKWIEQATYDGLVQACGTDLENMLFRPEESVTRAEAACMMYYALQAKD